MGAFSMRSEEDSNIEVGSLFAKKKTSPTTVAPLSGAAAVRQASREAVTPARDAAGNKASSSVAVPTATVSHRRYKICKFVSSCADLIESQLIAANQKEERRRK